MFFVFLFTIRLITVSSSFSSSSLLAEMEESKATLIIFDDVFGEENNSSFPTDDAVVVMEFFFLFLLLPSRLLLVIDAVVVVDTDDGDDETIAEAAAVLMILPDVLQHERANTINNTNAEMPSAKKGAYFSTKLSSSSCFGDEVGDERSVDVVITVVVVDDITNCCVELDAVVEESSF